MFRPNSLRLLVQAAAVQQQSATILASQSQPSVHPHLYQLRRTKATQVRTEHRPKGPTPAPAPPKEPESQIPIRDLPNWVQVHQAVTAVREHDNAVKEATAQMAEEATTAWSPQMILFQEHPTVDLPWGPSGILGTDQVNTPPPKVQGANPFPPTPTGAGKFRYTLDPASLPQLRPNQLQLTPEQRQYYEDNGFIVIKKLVGDHDLARFEARFKEFANSRRRIPEGMVIQKEVSKKGEALSEYNLYKLQELYTDDVFFDYCRDPNILDYVQQFTGPNILSVHSMFINKPPIDSSSSRHPLHQEIHYFPIRPEDRIVCTWMPLEPTNRENGCLVVIPASHKAQHLEHDYPDWEGGVNKFYYGIKDTSLAEKRIHVEMQPGDCLFFHPLTIHGSGVNRSKGFRKAFSCHFASADCDFIQVNGTIQEKLANELLSIYVDKLSSDTVSDQLKAAKIDYPTMWKLRSRLVRGEGPFKRV